MVVRLPAIACEDETFRLSDWPDDLYHRKAANFFILNEKDPRS